MSRALCSLLACLLLLGGCTQTKPRTATDMPLTGNDRDAYGCIGSAGYSWSDLRKSCLRIFEIGIPLRNLRDPAASTVAYIIDDPRSSALELFLPGWPSTFILRLDRSVWRSTAGHFTVQKKNGVYTVFSTEGTPVYQGYQP